VRTTAEPDKARPRQQPTAQGLAHTGVRAITYGTFDLFHVGHVELLRRIKERCDHLTVAVSTDEFNALKGKRSVMRYGERCALVAACRYVDDVIAEADWAQKEGDIVQRGIDLFVMGSDWDGRFDELSRFCRVLYLPRTEGVSSTELKERARHVLHAQR
jgi:glycerol-3-phosphate cytidylyltransferase